MRFKIDEENKNQSLDQNAYKKKMNTNNWKKNNNGEMVEDIFTNYLMNLKW